ncbi:unnamed protein product [Sphagnum balticum]
MVDLLKYTFKHRSDPFPVGFGYDIAVNAHWKESCSCLSLGFQTHSGLLLDMGTGTLAWRSSNTADIACCMGMDGQIIGKKAVAACHLGFRPIVVCSWTWGLEHLLGEDHLNSAAQYLLAIMCMLAGSNTADIACCMGMDGQIMFINC